MLSSESEGGLTDLIWSLKMLSSGRVSSFGECGPELAHAKPKTCWRTTCAAGSCRSFFVNTYFDLVGTKPHFKMPIVLTRVRNPPGSLHEHGSTSTWDPTVGPI